MSMVIKTLVTIAAVLGMSFHAFGKANTTPRKDFGYLVLGTIVTSGNKSVALLKHRASGNTKAVRVGMAIEKNLLLSAVHKKMVTVSQRGKNYLIRVGSSEEFSKVRVNTNTPDVANYEGMQRRGNKVTVNASYKDHLLKNELNKILMQAAAVPAFKDGKLTGFTLWEIEKGSIYEKLGFKNGDTITSINDNRLVDASQAVKVLMSLKNAKNLALSYTRGGIDQQMEVRVQ